MATASVWSYDTARSHIDPPAGHYNIEFTNNAGTTLHVNASRTMQYGSGNTGVLAQRLRQVFPVYAPGPLHTREVADWCFTVASDVPVRQENILRVVDRLRDRFPIRYRFTTLNDGQHSKELDYADMNCLYRFTLRLTDDAQDLTVENHDGVGPASQAEKSVVGFLRHVLELPATGGVGIDADYAHSAGFLEVELDNVMRQLSVQQLHSAAGLLRSFKELTERETFVPIPEGLASLATGTSQAYAAAVAERDVGARYAASTSAVTAAHRVAYSEDFFAILFFPIQHKIACLLPLFGPVVLLLVKTVFQTYVN